MNGWTWSVDRNSVCWSALLCVTLACFSERLVNLGVPRIAMFLLHFTMGRFLGVALLWFDRLAVIRLETEVLLEVYSVRIQSRVKFVLLNACIP